MSGHQGQFRPLGGGRRGQPPPQPLNPNFHLQNPNFYNHNPAFQYFQNLVPLQQLPSYPIQDPNLFVQNPNIAVWNPNSVVQNPNYSARNLNSSAQNPSCSLRPPLEAVSQPQTSPQNHGLSLERIEEAVAQARRSLHAAGESVSAWKVSQSVVSTLQVDSWSSLGYSMHEVPSLYRLMLTEGKVSDYRT